MKVIKTVERMKEFSREARSKRKTIGFVPTMGYLHDGHMRLVDEARKECKMVVVSIYVNPIQFGPKEDFQKYPRDLERDKRYCKKHGVDVLFLPSDEEMYPQGYSTYVEVVGDVTQKMCGLSRPGHFRGVATVVTKLFNMVDPDISYFGQKDAQQCVVIEHLVNDLNMRTDVRVVPTLREAEGLAMSSRNAYLSYDEKNEALNIYKALKMAESSIRRGERSAARIFADIEKTLKQGRNTKIDYIEMLDPEKLNRVNVVKGDILIAIAAFVGKTRLIDNIIIKV